MLNGATLTSREALEIVSEPDGRAPRRAPAAARRWPARPARWSRPRSALRGKTPPVCREMVRTLLHGHRYDGSRATRELGLALHAGAPTRSGARSSGPSTPASCSRPSRRGVRAGRTAREPDRRTEDRRRGRRDEAGATPPPSAPSTSIPPARSRPTRASRPATTRSATRPRRSSSPTSRAASREEPEPGTEHHGRFSEGEEELPDSPEKEVERRFSEGIEASPTSE